MGPSGRFTHAMDYIGYIGYMLRVKYRGPRGHF